MPEKDVSKPEEPKKDEFKFVEEPTVTKKGKVGKLGYTVETGRMPLKNEKEEVEAQMFFHYYKLEDGGPERPLVFTFNGGPGSPSVWLHMGAVGPHRVKMMPDGDMPAPPYILEENPETWLLHADLVFIDPVGTGFSRGLNEDISKKHWGLEGDIEAVGEFIRLFLTRKSRWTSPLYLAGESYGTTRASGLAGYLVERGVTFNGIILVSSIINFQTARFHKGNDLPYPLFLPTYAATAWFHGRGKGTLAETVAKAREFALGDYWTALAKGNKLVGKDRAKIRKTLATLTGLSETFLENCDLRPHIQKFCKELLRDQKRTVGRLDSRFKGIDEASRGGDQASDHDPSMSLLMGPYMALYNDYCRSACGYETDLEYHIFKGIKSPWEWGSAGEGHPDTSEALRKAMARNPYMGVMVASGYYDLATPYFATEYTVSHMGLDDSLTGNIEIHEYEAGHMMYIDEGSLSKLAKDVAGFFARTKGG